MHLDGRVWKGSWMGYGGRGIVRTGKVRAGIYDAGKVVAYE
jgi:hypothetical protein